MLDPSLMLDRAPQWRFWGGLPNDDTIHELFKWIEDTYHPRSILEFGMAYGNSAIYFLENCPMSKVTSFDPKKYYYQGQLVPSILRKRYTQTRFKFHNDQSQNADNYYEPNVFDFAYVDGAHKLEAVFADMTMVTEYFRIRNILVDNMEEYNVSLAVEKFTNPNWVGAPTFKEVRTVDYVTQHKVLSANHKLTMFEVTYD